MSLASAVWIRVNLLDFEPELRLAESHRFADYSLTAEVVPEREGNGERRKIKCSCDTRSARVHDTVTTVCLKTQTHSRNII